MANKFWSVQIGEDGKTTCPWCENINNHRATATCCEHIAKVQSNGKVLYYQNFKPLTLSQITANERSL